MKNIYLLKRSNQAGVYSCLIIAINEIEALKIAKKNYFSFTKDSSGNTIEKLNTNENNFIELIDFDDFNYEG